MSSKALSISEIILKECVTMNLFLWVSSSVQIWNPPSGFAFFTTFCAAFFGSSGCGSSLVWASFSAFSPLSTLMINQSRVRVYFCVSFILRSDRDVSIVVLIYTVVAEMFDVCSYSAFSGSGGGSSTGTGSGGFWLASASSGGCNKTKTTQKINKPFILPFFWEIS